MAPDERRQAIIDATLPLLLEHGPQLSTRKIAQAAGVAEGTIFRAFETKHDLIHATIHAAMEPDAAIARIEQLPADQPLAERIAEILGILRAEIQRTRSLLAHLARPALPPPHPDRLRAGHNPHDGKARLGVAVAAALAGYSDQLSVGTDFASRVLMALSFATSFTLGEDTPIDASQLADIVLHGIAKGES